MSAALILTSLLGEHRPNSQMLVFDLLRNSSKGLTPVPHVCADGGVQGCGRFLCGLLSLPYH